jgi:hypothetical protein
MEGRLNALPFALNGGNGGILKWRGSLFYVGWMKFPPNRFGGNFCP